MKTDAEIYNEFRPLWADIQDQNNFPHKRPLLAHYTSIAVLESIVANEEVWFSHPLYMNDIEELRFGMNEGVRAVQQSQEIAPACRTRERHSMLMQAFERYLTEFWKKSAFDIYIFCLSEHDPNRPDGMLSMWRGYGGQGNGVALVFDSAQVQFVDGVTPMMISKVTYASADDRRKWLEEKILAFSNMLSKIDIPDGQLHLAAHALLERIKIFSILTKHHGFSEECEWRAVYLRERDHDETLVKMLGYHIGPHGIEPKFKYQIKPIAGLTAEDLSLEKLVTQIILGPSISNPLAANTISRMLTAKNKPGLVSKLTVSSTPYRAR